MFHDVNQIFAAAGTAHTHGFPRIVAGAASLKSNFLHNSAGTLLAQIAVSHENLIAIHFHVSPGNRGFCNGSV